ncbi:hypothetical protein [Ensifer soli]|uniref:hypothetical protein n=1 Tax=Ciceribacter sp. sgz301302 TaxID=3342379 RepID=UPI0035BB0737
MIIHVTDHAVLRYLERAHGLDVEFFRRHISGLAASGVIHGAVGVQIEGVKLVLRGATVVTVLGPHGVIHPQPGAEL